MHVGGIGWCVVVVVAPILLRACVCGWRALRHSAGSAGVRALLSGGRGVCELGEWRIWLYCGISVVGTTFTTLRCSCGCVGKVKRIEGRKGISDEMHAGHSSVPVRPVKSEM